MVSDCCHGFESIIVNTLMISAVYRVVVMPHCHANSGQVWVSVYSGPVTVANDVESMAFREVNLRLFGNGFKQMSDRRSSAF